MTSLLFASLSTLKDKAICGQYVSVCEWSLVSICLVQGLTLESKCEHTKLQRSFHFSSSCFPAVPSVSTVFLFSFLSTMTLPIHPPSQIFYTKSNVTSLGHFILIAKQSNLVCHTHSEYAAHTWSYHSNATEKREAVRSGQKPNYCTTNCPLRIFLLLRTECWGGSLRH